jgi:hypothetical protein
MGNARTRRGLIVAVLVLGSLAFGCAKSTSDTQGAKPTTTTTQPNVDYVAKASDFKALTAMHHVRGFYVDNGIGDLKGTLAVANAGHGTYPVGSIIQLVPFEAMVKRHAGFDPKSNDWEFFELDVSKTGTKIHQRGGAEIVNRFGSGSCSSCHSAAGKQYDFVCEETHGCTPLPFGRDVIDGFQKSDPRPI